MGSRLVLPGITVVRPRVPSEIGFELPNPQCLGIPGFWANDQVVSPEQEGQRPAISRGHDG